MKRFEDRPSCIATGNSFARPVVMNIRGNALMRRIICFLALAFTILLLSACGAGLDATPTQPQGGTNMTATPTYPKVGRAPDYSWIAGRVTYTKIQGGCTYIVTDQTAIDAALGTPQISGGISGPIVSTAVAGDISPPLRDITPQTGPPPTQPPGVRFVASGPGWDPTNTKDGDYVLLFGRLAGPGDPQEICPGGTGYVVDTMQI